MNKKGIAVLVVGACVLCAAALLALVGVVRFATERRQAREAEARVMEDRERERLRALGLDADADELLHREVEGDRTAGWAEMKAVATDPLRPDSSDAAEFAPLFEALGRAVAARDLTALNAHCDPDRLLDEVIRFGGGRSWPGGVAEFRRDYRPTLADWLGKQLLHETAVGWDRVEVRRVQWSADRGEAVLIADHFGRMGAHEQRRWWLIHREDGWKFFDGADTRLALRHSHYLAHGVSPEVLLDRDINPGRYEAATDAVARAGQVLNTEGPEAAERLLEATRDAPLVDGYRVLVAVEQARIHVARNEFDAALTRLDDAERALPGTPTVRDWRVMVLNSAARHEEALAVLRSIRADFGPGPATWISEGSTLERLERRAEAARVYREALDRDPDSSEAFRGLIRTLPAADRAELTARLGRARDPGALYAATSYEARSGPATADALLDGLLKLKPDDLRALGDDIRRRVKKGQFAEASAVLKRALEAKSVGDRDMALNAYLFAMAGADRPAEAYATVPAALAARSFRTLAEDLEEDSLDEDDPPERHAKRLTLLGELIAAHRKRAPDDAWLWYFEGALLQHRKEYQKAEKAFADGAARLAPKPGPYPPGGRDWDAEEFRSRRVLCLFRAKKGVEALRRVEPQKETFAQLARLYDGEKDLDGLAALIAAYRDAGVRDPDRIYWGAHLVYRKKDYARAAVAFHKYLEESDEAAPMRWAARDELLRSLARTDPAEAQKSLAALGRDKASHALQAAVAAAAGDRAELERLLAESTRRGGPTWFYGDEDFRHFIQEERYRDLRAKYPDPNPPPKSEG